MAFIRPPKKDTDFQASYWRIAHVELNYLENDAKSFGQIRLTGYESAEARARGEHLVCMFPPILIPSADLPRDGTRGDLYPLVRKLDPYFADAWNDSQRAPAKPPKAPPPVDPNAGVERFDGPDQAAIQAHQMKRSLRSSGAAPAAVGSFKAHWEEVTSGTLAETANAAVYVDPIVAENDALRARIAELEAAQVVPPAGPAEPPAEALEEAYPDEDHAALKQRILHEFASLRNMLIGQIPMTQEQLDRLVALEHPKYQSWLQGVTK